MKIIGITGTLGAGKGTVVEYLVERYKFKHYSARAFITKEVERRGMPVNRDSMTEVANDLRAKHHPAYIIEELYKRAEASAEDSIIESVRAIGELELLRTKPDFLLLAIDADPKIRYDRIYERGSETDKISYDKFLYDEEREFAQVDPTKGNIQACMKMADFIIMNSGSLEELHDQVDKILE